MMCLFDRSEENEEHRCITHWAKGKVAPLVMTLSYQQPLVFWMWVQV